MPRVVATKCCQYKAESLALREITIKHNDVLCKTYTSKVLTDFQSTGASKTKH